MRAILLDIEGTTTPLSFVQEVLFPYARARLVPFARDAVRSGTFDDIAGRLQREHAADVEAGERPPDWLASPAESEVASAVAYAEWLMDFDRKSPALKHLQGLIWDRGYATGELHGVVYPDVPPALRGWREQGRTIAIYSSGSELAQRRLFATTEYGDLTPFIAHFFDTSVGAKVEPGSYARIAAHLDLPASAICFVSDVVRELSAARHAGLDVRLCLRPGNPPQPGAEQFPVITSFDEERSIAPRQEKDPG